MKCDKKTMLLYAVTDRAWTGKKTLYQQVEEALQGGATCVQLREKELAYDEFLAEAKQISQLCKRYNVPFFVNDNVDIAIKSNADGIHVGQEDMQATNVRKLVGDNMIIGVSVHNVEEALQAQQNGADCLGVGAMFSTSTKLDVDVLPYQTLCDICNAVDIPVVAIGGINKNNIHKLSGSGVDGVALVSAIFAADDIKTECQQLLKISSDMVNNKKFKGAILDFDGTLFDSMSIWETAGIDYLKSLGKMAKPNLREDLKVLSLLQSAIYLQKEYNLTLTIQEIMDGINKTVEDFYFYKAMPKPKVKEFLQELKNKGIKTCIATATDRYQIESALKRCDMLHLFDEIFTCTDIGYGKDQPHIFEEACKFLQLDKKDVAVFEDAYHASKTAKEAGFFLVGVYDKYQTDSDKLKEIANKYICSFDQAKNLF